MEESSKIIDLIEFRSNFLIKIDFEDWILSKWKAEIITFLNQKLFNKLLIFCFNNLDWKLVIKLCILHFNSIFIDFISFFWRKISFINFFFDTMISVLTLIIMPFSFSQFHQKINTSTVIKESFKCSVHQNRIIGSNLKTKFMRTFVILSIGSNHYDICKITKTWKFSW